MKGECTSQKESYGYQLNIKLTLGAIASGIGPTNLVQLLSFLDLENVKQVNGFNVSTSRNKINGRGIRRGNKVNIGKRRKS